MVYLVSLLSYYTFIAPEKREILPLWTFSSLLARFLLTLGVTFTEKLEG